MGKDVPEAKLKQQLLKSSLPLEHIVTQRMEESHFEVVGEYAYRKPNEFDKDTEFSVDAYGYDFVGEGADLWGILNLLVECKYCHPGVRWVFAPHPQKSPVMMGPTTTACLEELTTYRLRGGGSFGLILKFPICTHGVSLLASGEEPHTISRGLNQLRYAVPNLMADECERQIDSIEERHLWISLIFPILVTTATLHVLKSDLSIEDFELASNLDEVTEEEKFLVVHQQPGPQLRQYSNSVRVRMENSKNGLVGRRLLQASECRKAANPTGEHPRWDMEQFRQRFLDAGYDVLVVTLRALPELLRIIRSEATDSGVGRERIGCLVLDKDTGVARLAPLNSVCES